MFVRATLPCCGSSLVVRIRHFCAQQVSAQLTRARIFPGSSRAPSPAGFLASKSSAKRWLASDRQVTNAHIAPRLNETERDAADSDGRRYPSDEITRSEFSS